MNVYSEEDLEKRTTADPASEAEFLRQACEVSVSDSTISRVLKRLG